MENIGKKLSSAMDAAFGKDKVTGVEGHKMLNDFKAKLPQTEQETDESTGTASAGGYQTKLFSEFQESEKIKGGKADKLTLMDLVKKYSGKTKDEEKLKKICNLLLSQLKKGINIEMEHTNDKKIATEIAMDHLYEDPNYYKKLEKIEEGWSEKYKSSIDCKNPKGFSQKAYCQGKKKKEETKEATSTASSGSYVTPAAWAKSTSKKHWRGAAKTQIPGGKFVKIKDKCKKFPYCNQGNAGAITLFENDLVKNAIRNISKKHNVDENIIKYAILVHFEKKEHNKSK